MNLTSEEKLYFDSLGSVLSQVEEIEPDEGQRAEERLIELFERLELVEFWDYAKEWHSEPNCCVLVFQNLQKLSTEVFAALLEGSSEFPGVVVHVIFSDSIKGDLMMGGEIIVQLFLFDGRIQSLFIKNSNHPTTAEIVALSEKWD